MWTPFALQEKSMHVISIPELAGKSNISMGAYGRMGKRWRKFRGSFDIVSKIINN